MKLQTLFPKIACVLTLASAALAAKETRAVRTVPTTHRVLKTSGDISDFAFSRDGKTLVTVTDGWEGVADSQSAGDKDRNTVTVWDAKTLKVKRHLLTHLNLVEMALAPDGKTLATTDANSATYNLRIWNVASRHLLHTFKRGYYDRGICFSKDGRVLAAANRKCASDPCQAFIVLYDTRTWKPYRLLHGIEGIVNSIAISPDKRWIASSASIAEGSEEDFSIWDARTGHRIRHFYRDWKDYDDNSNLKKPALANLPFGNPTFLPDNKSLVAGNVLYRFALPSKVKPLLDGVHIEESNNIVVHPGAIVKVAFTRAALPAKTLEVWRLNPLKRLLTIHFKDRTYFSTEFSPDGRWLAMSHGKQLNIWRIP